MICPNCKYNLESEHNFCPSCGYDLRELKKGETEIPSQDNPADKENPEDEAQNFVICENCGEETPDNSGYCESCGANLTGKEQKVSRTSNEEKGPAVKTPADEKVENVEKSVKLNNLGKIADKKPAASNLQQKKQSSGQKKSQPVKQGNLSGSKGAAKVPLSQNNKQKNINPLYIGIFVLALVVVGSAVLYFSGVFGSHSQETVMQNNVPQQEQKGSAVNLENIQRINELESAVKADTSNLGNVLELAHLLNDSGFYERAIPYYRMYLRQNPRNVDVLVDMGVCYYNIRQYTTAISEMEKGWKINPRHQTANFNLGIVNFSAGNTDSAKIWWRKAIEIDPNSEIGKKAKELLDSH